MPKNSTRLLADAATESIKGLILAFGPKVFMAGLNNASIHGDIFKGFSFEVSDEGLAQWYDGIEAMSKAADALEES